MDCVAYQGEAGAYSELAVMEFFGEGFQPKPHVSFEKVFEAVEKGVCKFGMLPIENSLAGSIHRNYDLLLQHQLPIIGEYHLRVKHCLIALPGVKKEDLRKIISHPQALAQCDGYLKLFSSVEVEPTYDTAGSVKLIQENGWRTIAAIASVRAAEVHQMSILERGIEDNAENFTRFIVISAKPKIEGKEIKTSIVFTLQNQPGSLYKALSVFSLRDIDLVKIESRPLVGKPWEYLFYIDFAGSVEDKAVIRAIENLEEYAVMVRILGSYQRHRIPKAGQE